MSSILLGKFVRLDEPGNNGVCTISRIDRDLGGGFFLARRICSSGEETNDHVISLSMMAVYDGAELFDTYRSVLESIGSPEGATAADPKLPKLN